MAVIFSRGDKLEQGHYTIIKELGVGGMGVVYLCRDEQLMRDVAIKMLLPELMADKSNVDVFIQEARLAAQLEHPNIVTVFDIKVEERFRKQHHFVCMEYLPGGNLANRVMGGPLAVEHCLNWMKQLANGLTFAHKRGVIHQDIKADNIFITTEGDLKIGDFGLARLLVGRVHYKAANKGMGTPAYMSPELCHGDPQDHRSDIYSLGVLFFEMATGQLPFRARGMIEMATKHSSAPIPSTKRINPLIPEILDKVIRRMMAKTPQERYSSMSEVLTILDDLIFELRVARLGLSSRPMLRSGPVNLDPNLQKYLGQQAAADAPAQVEAVSSDKGTAKANAVQTTTAENISFHPDTSIRIKSEDLIRQLESGETEAIINQTRNISAPPDQAAAQTSRPVIPPRPIPADQAASQMSKPVAPRPIPADQEGSQMSRPVPPPDQARPQLSPSIVPGVQLPAMEKPAAAAGTAASGTDASAKAPGTAAGTAASGTAPASTAAGAASTKINAREPSLTSTARENQTSAVSTVRGVEAKLSPLWSLKTGGPIGWGSTPVLDRDERTMYCSSFDGKVYAVDASTGREIWRRNCGSPIVGAPLLHQTNLVVVSSAGNVFSLATHDGSVIWRKSCGTELYAPAIMGKDLLFLSAVKGTILSMEIQSGSLHWQKDVVGSIVSAPVRHGDLILVGTTHGDLHAFSGHDGKAVWKFAATGGIVASPIASVDSLYVGTQASLFYAIEAASGGLIWEYQANKPIISRGTIAFSSIVFASQDKWLYCCERYDGSLKWKAALRGRTFASPILHKDSIITVSREGWLQAFSTRNGELKWQKNCQRRIEATPQLVHDQLYAGTLEGELMAFALPSG